MTDETKYALHREHNLFQHLPIVRRQRLVARTVGITKGRTFGSRQHVVQPAFEPSYMG